MTPRQKLLVKAALMYAQANIDDLNDSYAYDGDGDDDNSDGYVQVSGQVEPSFAAQEVEPVLIALGLI